MSSSDSESDPGFMGFRAGLGTESAPRGRRKNAQLDDEDEDEDNPIFAKPMRYKGVNFAPPKEQEPVVDPESPESTPPPAPQPKPSFLAARKARTANGGGLAGSYGKGATMLAKMGYVEGMGLGADGRGIRNPIEQKLREGRLGLGGMNEKTKSSVEESRRRGDKESERKPEKAKRKPRVKYRTVEEIEASGLPVPSLWKNIIDLTGPDTKVLDDMSGFKHPDVPVSEEAENARLAELARRDLEMYADEWQGLQARRKYVDMEQQNLIKEMDDENESMLRLSRVLEITVELKSISGDDAEALEAIGQRLEILQFEFPKEVEKFRLDDVAVAALHPFVKKLVLAWDPLKNPNYLKEHLMRWQTILRVHERDVASSEAVPADDIYFHRKRHVAAQNRATLFESMMAEIWLPCVRRALLNDWNVHDASLAVTLFEEWQNILPQFIQSQLLEQIVLPRIHTAVSEWQPPRKRASADSTQPHQWIFPWMPLLGDHLETVMRDVRHKFKSVLRTWDPSELIEGLDAWREVFGKEMDHMLSAYILPKLKDILRVKFQINPADQDMLPLMSVLKWRRLFRSSVFVGMLESAFFPKWWDVLFMWLTTPESDISEVNQWYEFWQTQFPRDLRDNPTIKDSFKKGLDLIDRASYLGSRAPAELKPIVGPPPKPRSKPASTKPPPAVSSQKPEFELPQPSTYKDVVEDFCLENNILFMPLRRAHEVLGHPLYRITASGGGKGGFLCYFEHEVMWARSRGNDPDELEWEPLDYNDIEEWAHLK